MPIEIDAISTSGQGVGISGQYVYQGSGAHVVISGQPVIISGQPVDVSGAHVFVESGIGVLVQSGLHVMMSGQHVFVESGVHVITAVSGNPAQVLIQDLSGNIMAISRRHDSIICMPSATREVHKGEMYHFSYCQSGIAAGANLDVLINMCSGKEMHAKVGIHAGGSYHAWFYEKTAVSDSGTPVIVPNMNRVCSGQPCSLFSIGPTVTSTHTLLWCDIGGGTAFKGTTPGTTRMETEWVLNGISGSINYLLRVKNIGADAEDIGASVEFSEEDPVFWAW